MASEELTREKAQKLMEIKGEARGITLKVDWDFVYLKEGKEGIKKLEAKMTELGCPMKYKQIKSMDFYPIGFDAVSMLSIKEIFNYDDKTLEKMGASVIKFSLLMKVFMKYFVSLRLIAEQMPNTWRRHYTIGSLEMPDFSKEKSYAILKLRDFSVHPIYCIVLSSCFAKIAEMVTKSSVAWEETKCSFRGDEYHEFLLKW